MTDELWDRVRRFVRRYLRTLEQLEVLLLVARTADRHWSAAEAAQALGLPPEVVGNALEHLSAAGLLDVRLLDDVRYRLSPTSEELSRGVADVLAAHASQPVRLVSEVVKRRSQPIRDFADAFRLHTEDEDTDG